MIVECPGCQSRYDLSGRRIGSRARCRCGTSFVVPRPALEAGVLQCAACGAPCAPDDGACSYCSAVLAVIACAACFGRVFPGSEHCPHCGSAVLFGARPDPALLPVRACPRCHPKSELLPRVFADTLLDECRQCGGVWVESKIFDSLVKNRDQQARLEALALPEITLETRSLDDAGVLSARSQREYIPCPDCRQLMNRKNFGNISGVLIDICKPHGVWFDRGELGRIVQFVMRGGLIEVQKRDRENKQREERERRVNAIVLSAEMDEPEPPNYAGWVRDLLDIISHLLR